ncbi:hypothetical protein MF271_00600 (plasmid) [Deinococcus sp. KNUC1210]|uniref:hypothetical protein n=1 Tax=Deinococcus sp. KNUC1210 TaxID=2917691 RepID=UPI001EF15651|nr:hypothetical protein [Deinococcus sp. KNUC1210]ULH14013.1 hypothetical protein MF271_00600 [Deinococcus sp. KNUC1210]
MPILDELYPILTLYPSNPRPGSAHESPASEEEIRFLLEEFPNAPADYIEIVSVHNGCIIGGEMASLYIWMYETSTAYGTMKDWYSFLLEEMPDCFYFGQDGDDIYLYGSHEGKTGVYKVAIAGSDWRYDPYFAPSIRALLCHGEGWRNGEESTEEGT